ncbi:hypothetical protein PG991_006452 [Apiospora marii]|uniref:Uncharacterized protein n=1 Tax=Apiospora marii TaxID=335849 RepID=A0ABR1RZM5_9PEZI
MSTSTTSSPRSHIGKRCPSFAVKARSSVTSPRRPGSVMACVTRLSKGATPAPCCRRKEISVISCHTLNSRQCAANPPPPGPVSCRLAKTVSTASRAAPIGARSASSSAPAMAPTSPQCSGPSFLSTTAAYKSSSADARRGTSGKFGSNTILHGRTDASSGCTASTSPSKTCVMGAFQGELARRGTSRPSRRRILATCPAKSNVGDEADQNSRKVSRVC